MRHALIMLLLAIAMTAAPAIGFGQTASKAEAEVAQEIAKCMASRVPEPIEKCAVRCASPMITRLPTDQRRLRMLGKLRQMERLVTSGSPCSASANTRCRYSIVWRSPRVAKPARSHVVGSHSVTNVLMGDACEEWMLCDLAVQAAGAISFGVYPTASVSERASRSQASWTASSASLVDPSMR